MPATIPAQTVHVTCTPGVLGGKPCIAGTRIPVHHVYVWHEEQRRSVDEILASYPTLTRADVYAALAYCWDHREEILSRLDESEASYERARATQPSVLARRS